MTTAAPWEVGSAFPLALPPGDGWVDAPEPMRLYGSGRQALRALLDFGRHRYGWTAAHLPAYYCPEVVDAVADLLTVHRYDAGPLGLGAPPSATPSDVVVAVSYFGAPPAAPACAARTVIVDATHDPLAPWLGRPRADYVFASLRKTLPLPDGGVLWSYDGRELPPPAPLTNAHLANTGSVLSAMCLKAAYLDGTVSDKEAYRALYAAGEQGMRSVGVSSCSEFSRQALRTLPVEDLRRRRIDNAAELATELRTLAGAIVHLHTFGVVVEFDSPERREAIRNGLVQGDVYPAVLWPLPPDAALHHRHFARRMLFLPTDFRCRDRDLRRVATLLHDLCDRSTRAPAYPGASLAGPVRGVAPKREFSGIPSAHLTGTSPRTAPAGSGGVPC